MSERYIIIKEKLTRQLCPEFLEIRDDSDLHKNHGNVKKGDTETHFFIRIKASVFNNKSKLSMHKMVYGILQDEFSKGLHSLELDLSDIK